MELPAEIPFDFSADTTEIIPITGSGSNRKYWRLKFVDGSSLIVTIGTNREENDVFFYLSERLAAAGINVPQVLCKTHDSMAYVQTDVGEKSLFDCLDRTDLIEKAIDLLVQVQQVKGVDFSRCRPVRRMDKRSIMWDLNYFKYCFLKTCPGIELNENWLEDDFNLLSEVLLDVDTWGFMVRDFQSRNIMINNQEELALIDFQGARRGPVHYDLASFLWQARAGFSDELKDRMISRFCEKSGVIEEQFRRELQFFVIFRLMQVLGAYGLRGRFERKEHFLKSIPPALGLLKKELENIGPYFHYLDDVCKVL